MDLLPQKRKKELTKSSSTPYLVLVGGERFELSTSAV